MKSALIETKVLLLATKSHAAPEKGTEKAGGHLHDFGMLLG